jgi:hypothetical protein
MEEMEEDGEDGVVVEMILMILHLLIPENLRPLVGHNKLGDPVSGLELPQVQQQAIWQVIEAIDNKSCLRDRVVGSVAIVVEVPGQDHQLAQTQDRAQVLLQDTKALALDQRRDGENPIKNIVRSLMQVYSKEAATNMHNQCFWMSQV